MTLRSHLARVAGVVAATAIVATAQASIATAHTCGSNWCSGSDSNTSTNAQGNTPQVYIGEVDTYQDDFYGASGVAWSNAGANGAVSRFNSGGGIGVEDYYFGGGAGVNNQGVSNFCFGAKQGYDETYAMYVRHNAWWPYQFMSFLDIEVSNGNDYGWSSSEQGANRDVFNGWWDYVAGQNPCGYGANSNDVTQQGVYSSPSIWNSVINTGIPNTYVWTSERCCEGWPGSNWGGDAQWFGGSSYDWALQFVENPDQDDAYEPDRLPQLDNYVLGN